MFRYEPASVGFANLSSTALALNGANAPVPSATIGSTAASVSATGTAEALSGSATIVFGTEDVGMVTVLTSLAAALVGMIV